MRRSLDRALAIDPNYARAQGLIRSICRAFPVCWDLPTTCSGAMRTLWRNCKPPCRAHLIMVTAVVI